MSEELDIDQEMEALAKEINSRPEEGENEGESNESKAEEASSDSVETEDVQEESKGGEGSTGESEAESKESIEEDDKEDGDKKDDSEEEVAEKDEEVKSHPPSTWRPQAKDNWDKLNKTVQEEILKRESDMQSRADKSRDKVEYADRIQNVLAPYMASIQSKGGTPEQFLQWSGNLFYGLSSGTIQERVQVIQSLAQSAGVDLSNITPPSAVEQQLAPLQNQIRGLQQQMQQQNQVATQQQDSGINQAILAFESETDDKGNRIHPYFGNVQNEMISNASVIRSSNPGLSHKEVLQQAYDNAIWANPETRDLLQAQQGKEQAAEQRRKDKELAAKAKKAEKVNTSKGGSHDSKQSDDLGSIDDTMASTMKDIESRG